MKLATLTIAAVALTGCQSVRIQGVQLAEERPILTTALLVGGGLLIANELNDRDNSTDKPACKSYAPISDLKGGDPFCAIPLD